MPVKVSYNIELGPDLPNEVVDIARKQGEDPDRICADIQELRDMIFGKNNQSTLQTSFRYFIFLLFTQKEELVYHLVRMMTFSFGFCEQDSSNWSMHMVWYDFFSFILLIRVICLLFIVFFSI